MSSGEMRSAVAICPAIFSVVPSVLPKKIPVFMVSDF